MTDRDEIEQAIRAALQATLSAGVGGVLGEVARIANATDVLYLRDEVTRVEVRHVEVFRVDVDRASAHLDATLSVTAKHTRSGETIAWELLANGPVELERSNGAWLIHDLALNGLPISETYRVGDLASGSNEDAAARLVALVGSRESAALFVDVENRSDRALRIPRSAAAVRRRLGLGWRWSLADHAADELRSGKTRLQMASGAGRAGPTRPVRLLLETDRGMLDVRPAGARPRHRLPLSASRPTLAWFALVVPTGVAMGLLTTWSLAGLLVFTIASPAVIQLASTPEIATRHPGYVLSRMGVFLVGLGLFVSPYVLR